MSKEQDCLDIIKETFPELSIQDFSVIGGDGREATVGENIRGENAAKMLGDFHQKEIIRLIGEAKNDTVIRND